jgi:hypothetical protein
MCHSEYIYACLVMEDLREPMLRSDGATSPGDRAPSTLPLDPMQELAGAFVGFVAAIARRLRRRLRGSERYLPDGC